MHFLVQFSDTDGYVHEFEPNDRELLLCLRNQRTTPLDREIATCFECATTGARDGAYSELVIRVWPRVIEGIMLPFKVDDAFLHVNTEYAKHYHPTGSTYAWPYA